MYNKFDYDMMEQQEAELLQKALTLEDASTPPDISTNTNEDTETARKKLLMRDIKAAALERLEQSVKTTEDFLKVIEQWNKLDDNRERKERYWEISRSNEDFPLEFGEAPCGTVFPKNLNTILAKQLRKGDFIDTIYNCPYEIHELVTEEYLCRILRELKDEHKELLYFIAIKGLSTAEIADIQGKSARAVRYMRDTVFNTIRQKAYEYLTSEQCSSHDMTLSEKRFVENYEKFKR